jgi:hypothetical protein
VAEAEAQGAFALEMCESDNRLLSARPTLFLPVAGSRLCRLGENENSLLAGTPGHSRAFRILNFDENPTPNAEPPPVVSRHSSPRLTGPLVGAQIYPTPSRLRSAMDDSAGEAGSQSQVRRIRGASLSSAPQPLSRSKYGTRRSNPSRPLAYPRFLSLQVHACSSYPLSFPSRAFPSSLCLSRI